MSRGTPFVRRKGQQPASSEMCVRNNCLPPPLIIARLHGMLSAGCSWAKSRALITVVGVLLSGSSLTTEAANPTNTSPTVPRYSYDVVHTWPHDRNAFTQGLVFFDGQLLESTGLNGQSSLRRVDLETGKVIAQLQLPYEYFAEGL